jgi:SAM-dependent methyltransferase
MPSEPSPQPAHYSYAAYADPAMAERFDRLRFGGPIGRLLLEEQERVLDAFLGDVRDRAIVDVGTGTGRAALALARRGARVVGVDASDEMLAVARARASAEGVTVSFDRGDAHGLAFPDRAFDHAVSLRVLMHTPDWRRCVGELCRVTRQRVVVDFPALVSAAALQAGTRRLAYAAGRPVEAYRVISLSSVRREFARRGFRVRDVHRQFVLPIALHKRFGSRGLTRAIEGALAALGLLTLAGSPVTIVAERCEP